MGTINKGILGGFSGKVGNVVGGTWKGIDYMRSKSSRRNFTPTQPQLEQQLKFTEAIRFVQTMSGLVEISFRNFAIRKTGINNVLAPAVVSGAGSILTWSWTDNSGVGIAKPTDKAMLVAYCPALKQCIYTTGSASRSALTDSLNLAAFSGQDVYTWIGFISDNGQDVANSIYTDRFAVS